jgi:hypothetical protein
MFIKYPVYLEELIRYKAHPRLMFPSVCQSVHLSVWNTKNVDFERRNYTRCTWAGGTFSTVLQRLLKHIHILCV